LTLSGHTLFGTTQRGGAAGNGTVFAIENDGQALTNLYSFDGTNGGASPQAGLILSGDTVYGTAQYGGSSGDGTVFALKTDGTAFTNLHSFVYDDGAHPMSGLLSVGDTLYGTAVGGGGSGNGTVYAIKSDGTGFTNLYFFAATQRNSSYVLTNSDGANPNGGLVLLGDTLFGTTTNGGISGNGTVFALKTNGTGFTNLYVFTATHSGSLGSLTNSDGARPCAGLVLSDDTLYGTAQYGGISGKGTVFALKIDGTGFTNLHNFTATVSGRNSDGVDVWAINNDGANPYAGLILSGNTLYGVASRGGSWGNGTVFSLTVARPPQLTIIPSGANVILTWPTSTTGFVLQSASDLASPVAWTTLFPAATLIGGQNVVINPQSDTHRFFRLIQ
jgi:uncharacterized repeat protein (TIGR03803 family)